MMKRISRIQDGGIEGCASSPVRTQKLQISAEQTLTGECWILPKKGAL